MSLYALLSVTFAILVAELCRHGLTLTEAVDAVHTRFLPPPTEEEQAAIDAEEKRLRDIERARANEAAMMQVAGMMGGRTIE